MQRFHDEGAAEMRRHQATVMGKWILEKLLPHDARGEGCTLSGPQEFGDSGNGANPEPNRVSVGTRAARSLPAVATTRLSLVATFSVYSLASV